MDDSLLQLNKSIKGEADEILFTKGLHTILSRFGTPHISGSYTLDLMTWRDLDIYLQADKLSEADFFRFGSEICQLLHPVKMSFRNERIAQSKGLPHGLYWGVYLGNEREGAWKIDIWAVNTTECKRLIDFFTTIQKMLTIEKTIAILEIKSMCWKDTAYRRIYSSTDIYDAVLHHQVKGLADFQNYLLKKQA